MRGRWGYNVFWGVSGLLKSGLVSLRLFISDFITKSELHIKKRNAQHNNGKLIILWLKIKHLSQLFNSYCNICRKMSRPDDPKFSSNQFSKMKLIPILIKKSHLGGRQKFKNKPNLTIVLLTLALSGFGIFNEATSIPEN